MGLAFPHPLPPGRRVTINSVASHYHGQRGTIVRRKNSTPLSYFIKLDGGRLSWFSPCELTGNDETDVQIFDEGRGPIIEGKVAPLLLQIFLAIYVSPQPDRMIGEDTWNSSAGERFRLWLEKNDLINEAHADLTDKGRAWLKAILSVPLPVATWEIPK
jgi:hypothetical protein